MQNKTLSVNINNFETKESTEDGIFTIKGYASTFGNVDEGGDIVEKGAFNGVEKEMPLLWQHDSWRPIGVIEVLPEDEKGLPIVAKVNLKVRNGVEAMELVKQGAVKSFSIGYRVVESEVDKGVRRLQKLKLHEVSLVTFPMNVEAGITGFKSAGELTKREFETALREALPKVGIKISRQQAKACASRGFDGLSGWDDYSSDKKQDSLKTIQNFKNEIEDLQL